MSPAGKDPDNYCGGVRHSISAAVPKSVDSKDIVAFRCRFSLRFMTASAEDGFCGLFDLAAGKKDGRVECRFLHAMTAKSDVNEVFDASDGFLAALDEIIKDEDLASYNGTFYSVSGLPDMFGSRLSVEYASGERIDTSNNQSVHLPLSALRRIRDLFESARSEFAPPKKSVSD